MIKYEDVKNGDHVHGRLAKYGYNRYRKHKTLINLIYLWIFTKNQIGKFGGFY